jgi:2-polyprenyl-3-methyl-5-hydroxy-6-metoxy-1,4-benzoquinol methylase
MGVDIPDFGFKTSDPDHTVRYLKPIVLSMLPPPSAAPRVLDIGCGSGYWAGVMLSRGYKVVGIDPSEKGITIARKTHPGARFERTMATETLLQEIGETPFDVVLSLEVIEHVYEPRDWAKAAHSALKPGGTLICSTPYHGYLKNLALALTNGWDNHFTALWSGGHIKFWSYNTIRQLLAPEGFSNFRFRGAGRLPYLWMSMVVAANRAP